MSKKTDKARRQRMKRRRDAKNGTVVPILSGPELTTERCPAASIDDMPRVSDMIATLIATDNGVGLAAPQIGCNTRMFIMREPGTLAPVVFVNPTLGASSIEMATDNEGCLSEPGRFVPVERHLAVWVTWCDQYGKEYDRAFYGFSARIIQHEIDHLNGFCKVLSGSEE